MADFVLGRLKFNWRGNWAISTSYIKDDIVKYGANTYTCLVNHTSSSSISGFYTNLSAGNWSLHSEGLNFAGDWTAATFYKLNDLVKFGAYQYRCILQHTSGGTFSIGSNWSVYTEGFQFEDSYSSGTQYQDGDVVTYGGYAYIFVNSTPATGSTPSAASSDWDLLAPGFTATGDYSAGTAYKTGQTINFGGWAYVCVTDTSAGQNPYTHSAKWVKVNEGFKHRGTFSSGTTYFKGEVVEYLTSSYVAKEHNLLNILPTDTNNWQIIAFGDTAAVMEEQGDLISRNASIPIRLPIGSKGSILTTNSSGSEPAWGIAAGTVNKFVSLKGNDSNPGTEQLPYKTISYALSQVNKNSVLAYTVNSGGTGGAAGIYNNVPSTSSGSGTGATFKVTTDGSSVPTVTSIIVLNNGTNYATGNTITIDGANLGGSSNLVLTITNISVGDVINIDSGIFKENLPLRVPANTTIKGSGLRSTFISPNSGNSTTIATVTVSSGGVGGSNGTYNYIHQLSTNGSGNGAVFNITKSGGSVTAVTVYHGGYGYATANTITIDNSLLGGGTNLVLSVASLESNTSTYMFLVNNNTNLKDFSTSALTGLPTHTGGVLGAPVISLDPEGAITTASPYIQNSTSTSNNAIGIKIDGNLHSTGNRSIVANDYTMINSDGIGVFALGGGRGEMVSVFTYYNAKSFYALSGGFIRCLNCSSAYGEQGAVAEGTLASETPIVVQSRGKTLSYQPASVSGAGISNFGVGDTLVGNSSGATGTIIRVNTSADRITLDPAGTFTQNETVTVTKTNSTTYTFQVKDNAAAVVNGQLGFLIEIDSTDVTFLDQAAEVKPGDNVIFAGSAQYYSVTAVTNEDTTNRRVTLRVNPEVASGNAIANNTTTTITRKYSNVRLTGHDFLDIGTGDIITTNYPGVPSQAADQNDEVVTTDGGRVYFTSTDQSGDFRVGDLFRIQQSTGIATLNADAFDLSGLTELQLGSIGAQLGATINEFSTDGTMGGNSNLAVPTEAAVVTYLTTSLTGVVPLVNNTYDIGTSSFKWKDIYLNGALKMGGTSSGTNTISSDVTTGTVNLFTGLTTGTINIGSANAGTIDIKATKTGTSTTSAALVVRGGLGVVGATFTGGDITSTGVVTGNSLVSTTTIAGGGNITGNGNLDLGGSASSTREIISGVTTGTVNAFTGLTTGTLNVGSGSGGKVSIAFNTEATSSSVGALVVNGGIASGANINSGGNIDDSKGEIRTIPINSKSTGYTLIASDHGKFISITTGGVTVPSGIFTVGQNISIYNNSASSQTITQGGGVTLRSAGTSSTGNRTLALRGFATIVCVASNEFVINGGGLS
jgi:hypothetical protein